MKVTILLAACIFLFLECNGLPLREKREVIVDRNGFYLGGGSNNNIRESSQIFDLGGPIANPWINSFTQPHLRIPLIPIPPPMPPPMGGPMGGPMPPPPMPAPAYPPQQPAYQPPQQSYQPQPAYQPPQPAYQPQPQPAYQPQPQPAYQPPQPAYQPQPEPQPEPAYENYGNRDYTKPFTAVFIPGQATQFKLGTPHDFQYGSYTPI